MKKRLKNGFLSTGLLLSMIFAGAAALSYSEDSTHHQEKMPVKGFGTENRKWVEAKETLPVERFAVKVQENIKIEVRDGKEIHGRLLLPEGLNGPLPTIVQLNGYGHGEYGNSSEQMLIDLTERGYAVLHVSLRSANASQSKAGLYDFYGKDGYDVIEWAAKQKWSNGKVGTTGFSLNGISQWLAAKELPPSLKAISPGIACASCYGTLWHPGGMESGPGRIAREIEYMAAKKHRNFDKWWQGRTVSAKQLEAIADSGVAAFISGGWNDYISPGNIEAYEIYSAQGGTGKLIVSPGSHSYLSGTMPYEFKDYQAMWFDHFLKGEDNGMEERDPVLIYVQGAGQWRYEDSWPIADTNYVDLFLSEHKSHSIDSINDGTLKTNAPAEQSSSISYSYSPEKGPFMPSLLSSTGRLAIDQRPYEEEAVTWTTDALAMPVEVTGNMSATFWAEVDAEDADFIVQVTDVAPTGSSKQIVAGYLNASRATSRTAPKQLTPGEVRKYTVDILPTSYVFKKGHRIRLSIAGGAKALETQPEPQGPGINMTASTVKIHQGIAHPSSFKVPLIGVGELKTIKAEAQENGNAPIRK